MSTFTRIVQESLGGVSVVNTYSMRGDFTPADAFKALAKAHPEEEAAKPEPITINLATPRPPTPPMDHFVDPVDARRKALWDATIDRFKHAIRGGELWSTWTPRTPCLSPKERDAVMRDIERDERRAKRKARGKK